MLIETVTEISTDKKKKFQDSWKWTKDALMEYFFK